jgi:uncharacterized membrane protein YeaQ/YmgE (transglycosylase-associated protein family)
MDIGTLLIWIIVGAIAGWLASIVMKTNTQQGLLEDIMVGVIGGFIGGLVFDLLDVGGGVSGINVVSIITAFVGSVILLAMIRMLRRV